MPTPTSILVCLAALDRRWGLGDLPVPGAQMLLIAWPCPARPAGAAVPDQIAVMLGHALCAVGQVSFPVSKATVSDLGRDSGTVRVIKPLSLVERAEAVIGNEHVNINLLSTHLPATTLRLFEDYVHPWPGQGQVALMSAFDRSPAMDRKTLQSLLNGAWTNRVDGLKANGVRALLRPCADANVAGVLSFDDEFTAAFLPALEREARRAEFEWQVLGERDFAARLGKPSRRVASA